MDGLQNDARWRLAGFTGSGYDRGRGALWQAAWILTENLLFKRVWFPASGRRSVLRLFGATIGDGVLIRHQVKVHWPWKLTIGENTWIGVGAWILNLEPVVIGSDSVISQEALICTGSHDQTSKTFEFDNAPIRIGSCVWIGTRAVILRGVTIGDNVTIPACATVRRNGHSKVEARADLS